MRRIIIWFFTTMLLSQSLMAQCDMCSGSGGGNYFGILPQFRKNFIGLRYQNSSFSTKHLPPLLSSEPPTISTETFNSMEVWGRFYPHRRVQFFAFLPYHVISQSQSSGETNIRGLGDVMLLANYLVFDTGDSARTAWKQTLLLGGGMKLPTGQWQKNTDDITALSPNLRPGTGSTDILGSIIYTVRHKQSGINMDMVYRYNTSNANNYNFGNRFTSSIRAFRWYKTCDISLLPHIGVIYERSERDETALYQNPLSGGQMASASIGGDVYFKRWAGGISYIKPIVQNLAAGKITAAAKINTHLIFMF